MSKPAQINDKTVVIHTDGACKGNPGPGGWGALLEYGGVVKELFGGESDTTNNRMELTAVIEALRALKRDCDVRVVTDSQYVQKGVESWMDNWKRKNWKTSAGKPVANRDLWEALDRELQSHRVAWEWVKGHDGHSGNERADELANRGVESITLSTSHLQK
ncbi:ribonuclease HI [beta proteobacterium MWH-UniP1]